MTRKAESFLLLVGTFLVVLCFPGVVVDGAEPEESAHENSCLRVVMYTALPMLDPFLQTTAANEWMLHGNVWESLVDMDAGRPRAGLASRWTHDGDRTWLFEIRSNVLFHDGSKLTVADVVASIERARLHPESDIKALVSRIEDVSAVSENTVEILLKAPVATLMHNLSKLPIVAHASQEGELKSLVGTGPYRVASHTLGKGLRLDRFSEYWGEAPSIECGEFVFESDASRRVAMLSSGEAHIVYGVPPEAIEKVEARRDLWVESSIGGMVRLLILNSQFPPLDDPRVREAIALSVDREALAHGYFANTAHPAYQLAPPGAIGHLSSYQTPKRDVERARKLLAEVGDGKPVSLDLYAGDSVVDVAAILARQLGEAGFEVNVISMPWGELYLLTQESKVPLVYMGWRLGTADAAHIYEARIHTYQPDGLLGRANDVRFSNPDADRLIEASIGAFDPQTRRRLLEQVSQILLDDRPVIPLVRPLNLIGVQRSLRWKVPPDPVIRLASMSLDGMLEER